MSEKKKVNEQDVLKALLSVGSEKPIKEIFMKRFGVYFTLQAINGKAVNQIKERATFTTKKGKEFDEDLFNALIIEKGCTTPNWNATELLSEYGSSDQAILTILLAGEQAKLSAEILELSGFKEEDEDDESSVKN